MMPASGDTLRDLTRRPSSHTANASQSLTLCMTCRTSRRPELARTRRSGSPEGRSIVARRSQTISTPGQLPAYAVPFIGYTPSSRVEPAHSPMSQPG